MPHALALAASLLLLACSAPADGARPTAPPASAAPAAPAKAGQPAAAALPTGELTVRVLARYPHDRGAYTQGLLWHEGALYESTGLYGESSLRQVDLETGEVLRRVDLPPDLFAEGLTRLGSQLVQLTWQERRALIWDLATFAPAGQHTFAEDGWGLCLLGSSFVMTDGSDRLIFRNTKTFAVEREVRVKRNGKPLAQLNELECVGGDLYANVYQTDTIVRVDPKTGNVTATIDASGLLQGDERWGAEVLNGIAYRPETDTFLLTGKRWPKVFEVKFVKP
jgi:glutaminyl-peptide cyclotransferase